jgi:hypothetical protein
VNEEEYMSDHIAFTFISPKDPNEEAERAV